MQGGKVSVMVSEAPRAEPQCEALFKLFDGAHGSVELGRLLKGNDTGRLVTLRRLPGAPSPDLASATDLARSVAHPRLAKVLGNIVGRGAWYVASEYIPGVTLFELGEAIEKQSDPLDPAVAARVVLDTLTAAAEAQQLLATTANLNDVRCVFADSIWIAIYGEVFVSEVLIAPLLAEATEHVDSAPSALADLRSAGRELSRLLGDQDASPELREILQRMEGGEEGYETLTQAIAGLRALGPQFIASEQRVSEELQRVLGVVLERRNQKIKLLERGATEATEDDQTRYFRVAAPPQRRNTTRPPEAERSGNTTRPPQAGNSFAPLSMPSSGFSSNSDSSATEPPAAGFSAPFVPAASHFVGDAEPTVAPPTPTEDKAFDDEDQSNPISDVWRQARELLDTSAQRAKQQGRPLPDPARRRAPTQARPLSERAAELILGSGKETERVITPKIALAIIGLLALGLIIRALW